MSSSPAGRRIVAKFGTKLLTDGQRSLSDDVIGDLVRQVAALVDAGAQVAIVTSGAVAAGRDRVRQAAERDAEPAATSDRQVLAAIGQSHLVDRYDEHFRQHGLIAAQALLTRADLADRAGYLNARNTIAGLLALPKVVPLINENDVVADEELRGGAFGENDGLSALVANLIDANLLILLSDVHGLYRSDPAQAPDAEPLAEVEDIPAALLYAGPAANDTQAVGRGGMRAKVEAADLATRGGCAVVIAHGREPDALLRIPAGEPLGTRFPARASHQESRKRWLLSGLASAGAIVIDPGAVAALRDQGRSLLPAGVVEAQGRFQRGDIVELRDPAGGRVAVGISDYGSDEIARIRGQRSHRIVAILGYDHGQEVVHRNNLALL